MNTNMEGEENDVSSSLTQPLLQRSNSNTGSNHSNSNGNTESSLDSVSIEDAATIHSTLFDESLYTKDHDNNNNNNSNPNSEPKSVYQDAVEDMTYARRLARRLMQYDWYYPKHMKEYHTKHNVSLDAGWEYYEHQTLYRHKTKSDNDPTVEQDSSLEKVEPGEHRFPTQLYGYWGTPGDQLGDFGIGIGVYFSTTWWLGLVTFVAGIISLSSCIYLASDDYTDQDNYVHDIPLLLRSSAICSDQVFVPCPNCTESQWSDDNALNRYALSDDGLVFAKHNECEGAQSRLGYVTVASIVFLIIAIKVLNHHQEKIEVAFDEDEQTAQDYSLSVDDCPDDALDPEEWRRFFIEASGGGHVTAVTVSINNGELVNNLVNHRLEKRKLKLLLDSEISKSQNLRFENPADLKLLVESSPESSFYKKYLMIDDARSSYEKLMKFEKKIVELCDKEYSVTDVFVTFETEQAQRTALSNLSVGKLAIINQDQSALPDNLKFRGNIVLDVSEPAEPSAVRWQDVATHWKVRVKGLLFSFFLTMILLVAAAYLVLWRANEGDTGVAIYIASMNVIFPMMCRSIVEAEVHPDEGDRAMSLYMKVTVFRWVNTAIIIFAATPFTHSLSDNDVDLIPRIYTIFFAELITAPLILLSDVMGNLQRHVLAPRAKSQEEVNSLMRGTIYEIAERYTTVTKLLFLCFFYASLYPTGYFVCAGSLFATYMSDKFAVLRIWRPAPMIGNEVADFGRRYFFTFAILALVIVNGYLYAMFPYDNLCETDEMAGLNYAGTYNITKQEDDDGPTVIEVTINATDPAYAFCDQNIFTSGYFPPRSDVQDDGEWMTSEQEGVVDTIGWTGLGFLIIVITLEYLWTFHEYVKSYFEGDYEPSGEDQNIPYSSVASISAYVPQVRTDQLNFPLLACSIDDIDPRLIGFTDPYNSHQTWSLMKDFPSEELKVRAKDHTKPILSIVKHYPPPKKVDE